MVGAFAGRWEPVRAPERPHWPSAERQAEDCVGPRCGFALLGHGPHPLLLSEAVAAVRRIEAVWLAASPGDRDRDDEGAVGMRGVDPCAEALHGSADVGEVSDLRSLVAEAFA